MRTAGARRRYWRPIQIFRQYQHMTFDEFVAAAKEELRQLQERPDTTGSLTG